MRQSITITSLSYDTILAEVKSLANSLIPDWDVDSINDPVVLLLELSAAIAARNNLLVNSFAQEFNLLTARETNSIYGLARTLGYQVSTRQPSTVGVQLTVVPPSSPVVLPRYSVVLSTTPVGDQDITYYENLDDITLLPGNNQLVITFVAGRTFTEQFVSDGTPLQDFRLSRRQVMIEDSLPMSLQVTVDGVVWTYVTGFVDSVSDDRVYTATVDGTEGLSISFGDNIYGYVPPKDAIIDVRYRVGGGSTSNVLAGKVDKYVSGSSYVTNCLSIEVASGGRDPESLDHIKFYAVQNLVAGGQLNTLLQVKNYLESLTPVARSKVVLSGNLVIAQTILQSSYDFNATRDQLLIDIKPKLIMGYTIDIVQPKYFEVNVDVTVFLVEGAIASEVVAEVESQISRWLDPLAIDDRGRYINDFGQSLKLSDLGVLLKSVTGIYDYVINSPTANIDVLADEIPTNVHTTTDVTVTIGGTAISNVVKSSGSYILP